MAEQNKDRFVYLHIHGESDTRFCENIVDTQIFNCGFFGNKWQVHQFTVVTVIVYWASGAED